jgi:hypothetical protein
MTSIASSFAISSLVDISAAADKLRIIASAPGIFPNPRGELYST